MSSLILASGKQNVSEDTLRSGRLLVAAHNCLEQEGYR